MSTRSRHQKKNPLVHIVLAALMLALVAFIGYLFWPSQAKQEARPETAHSHTTKTQTSSEASSTSETSSTTPESQTTASSSQEQTTASSSSAVASSPATVDLTAIRGGNFSGIAGTWQDNQGSVLVVTADGSVTLDGEAMVFQFDPNAEVSQTLIGNVAPAADQNHPVNNVVIAPAGQAAIDQADNHTNENRIYFYGAPAGQTFVRVN